MQVVERVRPHYILIAQKQQDKVPSLVKSVPTPSVNSTANSAPSVNSIQSPKAQPQVVNSARSQLPGVNSNQSVNSWQKEKCVKQLVLRKEIQEAVQRSEPKVLKFPLEMAIIIKPFQKSQLISPLTQKQVYRKATHSEDPLEKGNQTQDTHTPELT